MLIPARFLLAAMGNDVTLVSPTFAVPVALGFELAVASPPFVVLVVVFVAVAVAFPDFAELSGSSLPTAFELAVALGPLPPPPFVLLAVTDVAPAPESAIVALPLADTFAPAVEGPVSAELLSVWLRLTLPPEAFALAD